MEINAKINTSIERLEQICETIPQKIQSLSEEDLSFKPSTEKWSKKEIIGHLIDSATNNHHRIVRGQYEELPKIAYDNQTWQSGNHYQDMSVEHLVTFWIAYNRYFLELIKLIPAEKLTRMVKTGEQGDNNLMNIEFLIKDYIDHMEHHLKQVIGDWK